MWRAERRGERNSLSVSQGKVTPWKIYFCILSGYFSFSSFEVQRILFSAYLCDINISGHFVLKGCVRRVPTILSAYYSIRKVTCISKARLILAVIYGGDFSAEGWQGRRLKVSAGKPLLSLDRHSPGRVSAPSPGWSTGTIILIKWDKVTKESSINQLEDNIVTASH